MKTRSSFKRQPPSVFISYSWTSPRHEDWVLDLATELRSIHGIDVRLDKWHMGGPGGDSIKFMESMVSDPKIGKVLIISDREYVRKANERQGGAGKEAQILTPELYSENGGDERSQKYAVVVTEYEDTGKPCIPVFYGGRLYIDMSNRADRLSKIEEIVRWAYDRPIHVAPPISGRPPFLGQGSNSSVSLAAARRATASLMAGLPGAARAAEDYFDRFIETLKAKVEELSIEPESVGQQVSMLIDVAGQLAGPYSEAEEVLLELVRARLGEKGHGVLRRYLKGLLPLVCSNIGGASVRSAGGSRSVPFQYLVPDLVRAVVAALVRGGDFKGIFALTAQDYLVQFDGGRGATRFPFTKLVHEVENACFREAIPWLRKKRHTVFARVELMEADVLLGLASFSIALAGSDPRSPVWKVSLLVQGSSNLPNGALPVFSRAESKVFLNKLGLAFGLGAAETILMIEEAVKDGRIFASPLAPAFLRELLSVGSLGVRP